MSVLNFFNKNEENMDVFSSNNDRNLWINTLSKIINPVLENMANETLKKRMPIKSITKERGKFAPLEAVGRTICGIAPWLELGYDSSSEGKLRQHYIDLAIKGLKNISNPSSCDYLVFEIEEGDARQPLVDAAHLAEGLIRGKNQIWNNLDNDGQIFLLDAFKKTRAIEPWYNNWILFPSMIEAFILEVTGDCDFDRLLNGVNIYKDQWYCGDGFYGDGPNFHFDYYNSYVIHPMLTDTLQIMRKHNIEGHEFLDTQLIRLSRYVSHLERLISPEGTYPVVGRSMIYRTAAFQALGQACLLDIIPSNISQSQVKSALTKVISNQFSNENFDKNGWLKFGFNGNQPKLAEEYSNTGSLYLCTTGFLPLGLDEKHIFWKGSTTKWTSKKAWDGDALDSDMYIRD